MTGSQATEEPVGYRPVSMLAVAAALAGVASGLSLASPLLWSLPLIGAGLAVAALADVSRAGAEKAGRSLALAGLALSIGFGAQAVTSSCAARWITESRVRSVTNEWLDAIRDGSLADAQSVLAADVIDRARPKRPTARRDHAHDAADESAMILAVPAVEAIRGCGATAKRDIRCTGPDDESQGSWNAVLRLSPCDGGGAVEIRLQLAPSVFREGARQVERWLITKVDVAS